MIILSAASKLMKPAAMQTVHEETLNSVLMRIDAVVSSNFMNTCCRCDSNKMPRRRGKECLISYKVGILTRQLLREGIWPLPRDQSKLHLGKISSVLSKMEVTETKTVNERYRGPFCGSTDKIDLKEPIGKIMKEVAENQRGLCLRCAKHGNYGRADNCGLNPTVACAAAPKLVEMVFEAATSGG